METNADRFKKINFDGIESTVEEGRSNPDEQNYTKDDPGKIQVGEFTSNNCQGLKYILPGKSMGLKLTLFMCHVTAP